MKILEFIKKRMNIILPVLCILYVAFSILSVLPTNNISSALEHIVVSFNDVVIFTIFACYILLSVLKDKNTYRKNQKLYITASVFIMIQLFIHFVTSLSAVRNYNTYNLYQQAKLPQIIKLIFSVLSFAFIIVSFVLIKKNKLNTKLGLISVLFTPAYKSLFAIILFGPDIIYLVDNSDHIIPFCVLKLLIILFDLAFLFIIFNTYKSISKEETFEEKIAYFEERKLINESSNTKEIKRMQLISLIAVALATVIITIVQYIYSNKTTAYYYKIYNFTSISFFSNYILNLIFIIPAFLIVIFKSKRKLFYNITVVIGLALFLFLGLQRIAVYKNYLHLQDEEIQTELLMNKLQIIRFFGYSLLLILTIICSNVEKIKKFTLIPILLIVIISIIVGGWSTCINVNKINTLKQYVNDSINMAYIELLKWAIIYNTSVTIFTGILMPILTIYSTDVFKHFIKKGELE